MIKLDINIGDIILVGRFKNKRIEVKEFGNGVWFTYDFDYAKDIAGRNTIIFALDSKYLHLFKKEYTVKSTSRLKYDLDTDLIIKEKVPLKYLKVVTNKI